MVRSGVSRHQARHPLRLQRPVQRQRQLPDRSLRITRAFHQLLRLPIAPALFGLVQLTERSCATVSRQGAALALKFSTAMTSSMCWAQIRSGIGGIMAGLDKEPL